MQTYYKWVADATALLLQRTQLLAFTVNLCLRISLSSQASNLLYSLITPQSISKIACSLPLYIPTHLLKMNPIHSEVHSKREYTVAETHLGSKWKMWQVSNISTRCLDSLNVRAWDFQLWKLQWAVGTDGSGDLYYSLSYFT